MTVGWIFEGVVSDDDATPLLAMYTRTLGARIGEYFERLDSVVVEWRFGGKWRPSTIRMQVPTAPAARDLCSAEVGARELLSRAQQLSQKIADEKSGRHPKVRFVGLGLSERGDSAKQLFALGVSFDEDEEGNEEKSRSAAQKDEWSSLTSAQNDAVEKMKDYAFSAIDKCVTMAEKQIEMADKISQNSSVVVEAMKLERKIAREKLEHIEALRDSEARERMFAEVWKDAGPMFRELGTMFLAQKLGLDLDPKTMSGPYASRFSAILEGLEDEQLSQIYTLLGDGSEALLAAMSKAATDEAFGAQAAKLRDMIKAGTSDSGKARFGKLAKILGMQKGMALYNLFKELGIE